MSDETKSYCPICGLLGQLAPSGERWNCPECYTVYAFDGTILDEDDDEYFDSDYDDCEDYDGEFPCEGYGDYDDDDYDEDDEFWLPYPETWFDPDSDLDELEPPDTPRFRQIGPGTENEQ